MRNAIIFLVCAGALWIPAKSDAQLAGVGSGTIVGVVTDDVGAVVREVDVTISGRTLPMPRKTTTADAGGYRFVLLPAGDYAVQFESAGFAKLTQQVHVGLAATVTLDVRLTIAPQREDVAVIGSLDRQSAVVSQSFNARELADVPASRSLGGLFANTHGMSLSTIEVGGGAGLISGSYGAYGRNNSPKHTLEGIVVTGLFGAGFSPDYGAVEEVSILTASQGAEWASSGVHTDITTKSGSNQYRGSFYAATEPRRWQSTNINSSLLSRQANQVSGNRDFNADVGGFVRKNRLWWYSSFRYQDVAARLVNFPVEPYETTLTNYSAKATYSPRPNHTLVLYGQQGLNHQPTRLDPFGPGGGLSAASAINLSSESTADQRYATWVWKAEWNAIVRNSMVFEVRGGQFAWEQEWTPRSTAPRFEDIESLVVRGGNRGWESSARRNQFIVTSTFFGKNRAGQHSVRTGVEAIRFLVKDTMVSGYPGNVLHVLRSGRPSSVYLFETPSRAEGGVWSWSAYVSDAWQPGRRLTLTLGVRFDRYRLFLPAQSHAPGTANVQQFAAVPNLIDWNLVVPRMAAVFDVTGTGRTLAKFSLGRYRVSPNAGTAFNANPNQTFWWKQYDWIDRNQNGAWEPGEQGATPTRLRGGANSNPPLEAIDPNLEPSVLDEAGAWIEQSLPAGITMRTGAVWRFERNLSTRQNLNQPYDRFNVPVTIVDRGPDGLGGTADDGPPIVAYDLDPDYIGQPARYEVRNVPGASNEYFTLESALTRQTRGRWSLGAGFTFTWNRDQASSYSGQSVRNSTHPLTPNDLINTGHGGGHEFTTWTAKAHGTYESPWGVRITPVLRHQSGQPFGRTQTTDRTEIRYGTVTVLMEPVGTRRMNNITLVDIRFEKTMRLKDGRIAAFIDVFNCFNANPAQNVIWSSGPSFLQPLTIVPPRIARIGLTFDW